MSSSSVCRQDNQCHIQSEGAAGAFTVPELLFVLERVLKLLHRTSVLGMGSLCLLPEKHNEHNINIVEILRNVVGETGAMAEWPGGVCRVSSVSHSVNLEVPLPSPPTACCPPFY